MNKKPRILFMDIETFPIEAYAWQLFDVNIGLNQIKTDWSMASFCAKWQGDKRVTYMDVSTKRNCRDDKALVTALWYLLNEADIVVGQNSDRFDIKKSNARFIYHGLTPPSPFRSIDTLKLAKKSFAFTSNKLEYTTDHIVPKTKKDNHKEFPGFELWKACMSGNKRAWAAMKKYNIQDVISLESYYDKLLPWYNPIDFRVYSPSTNPECSSCGGTIIKQGFKYTKIGKFQQYQCRGCGAWQIRGANLLSKKKKASLK